MQMYIASISIEYQFEISIKSIYLLKLLVCCNPSFVLCAIPLAQLSLGSPFRSPLPMALLVYNRQFGQQGHEYESEKEVIPQSFRGVPTG